MVFDGSDVGLSDADVDAFAALPNGHLLISLEADFTVPVLGLVSDADILEFTPTALGETTAGSFAYYFDASDVGMDKLGEDVDGVDLLADGKLRFGVKGALDARSTTGFDQDLFRFNGTSLGETTKGTFTQNFDGSRFSLTTANEDVEDTWTDPITGELYFTTLGAFHIASHDGSGELRGDGNDVIRCQPNAAGDDCTFTRFWDGGAAGLGDNLIDGLQMGAVPTFALNQTPDSRVDGLANDDVDQANPLDLSEVPDDMVQQTQSLFLPLISTK